MQRKKRSAKSSAFRAATRDLSRRRRLRLRRIDTTVRHHQQEPGRQVSRARITIELRYQQCCCGVRFWHEMRRLAALVRVGSVFQVFVLH